MTALMNTFSTSSGIAVAGGLCGVALLYLVVSRTLKKRSDES